MAVAGPLETGGLALSRQNTPSIGAVGLPRNVDLGTAAAALGY
jgi:hypothetical protein